MVRSDLIKRDNMVYMKKLVSNSLEETRKIAVGWLRDISTKYDNTETNEALLIGLSGHLGAGKTAFVKMVAKELGVKEEITSPTFVLMKIYEIADVGHLQWKHLVHVDAYRLERPEELEALRFEDVIGDKNNLVLVEWPEQVGLEKFGEKKRLTFEMKDGVCTILM